MAESKTKAKDDKAKTDADKKASEKAAAGSETRQAVQPQVALHAQYVKDFSFESPSSPDVFLNQPSQPNVEVAVNVASTRLENNHFEVVLKIAATAKTDDKTIFVVELSYGGIASSNVTDEKMLHPLIAIEGPRLLFPFARAVVANITREGGFLPLNLNPIDFLALYQQNIAQQQAAASAPEKSK
ncbi:MAG: protein-export chaperone SecB [Pseudomonadota bacterium]|nr:protein-export chaperone SecB [Pseudomonadota bacterium]